MTRRVRGPGPIRRWPRRLTVPDKQRRPDIGNLISAASSDIQPIKRGGGLSGMIGGQRTPATRAPRAAGERRSEVAASTSRSTQRAIGTVRRRESAEESVTRQNKTFRLLPELARDIAVAAAER